MYTSQIKVSGAKVALAISFYFRPSSISITFVLFLSFILFPTDRNLLIFYANKVKRSLLSLEPLSFNLSVCQTKTVLVRLNE